MAMTKIEYRPLTSKLIRRNTYTEASATKNPMSRPNPICFTKKGSTAISSPDIRESTTMVSI